MKKLSKSLISSIASSSGHYGKILEQLEPVNYTTPLKMFTMFIFRTKMEDLGKSSS